MEWIAALIRTRYFWTKEFPEAVEALPKGAKKVWVGEDRFSYWKALKAEWTGKSDLLIVEHDIVLHDDVLPQLQDCEKDWCTFPYHSVVSSLLLSGSLGCTRFSANMQRAFPDFPERSHWESCAVEWQSLDGFLWRYFTLRGWWPHSHSPNVEHLHTLEGDS